MTTEDLILKFGAEDAASAVIAKLGFNMDGLGGKIGAVVARAAELAAVLGTAVVATLVAATAQTIEAGHAAFEMSEKFGLAASQASSWLAAASAVGVSNEAMSIGFKFAAKNMEAINLALQNGHKPAAALVDAYQALGIKIYDTAGNLRPLNDLMLDAADAFAKMPDGAEKAGLAVKLFGRSGSDLIPILNEGRDGILALMQAAQESGVVLTDSQVKTAQAAYLAQKQFDQALKGVSLTLGAALLPYAVKLLDWFVSVMPRVMAFASALENRVLPYILLVVDGFQRLIAFGQVLLPALEDLRAAVSSGQWAEGLAVLVEKIVGGNLGNDMAQIIWQIVPPVQGLWEAIQKIIPVIQQWAAEMWQQVSPSLQDISKRSGDFVPVLQALGYIIEGVAIALGVVIIVIANLIVWLVKAVDWVLQMHDAFMLWFNDSLPAINNFAITVAKDIQTVIGWFQALWDIVSQVAGALNGLHGGNINIGSDLHKLGIPGFAQGGTVPGPIGQPMIAIVHGGESVQTPGQQVSMKNVEALLAQAVAVLTAMHNDTGQSIYGQTAVQQTGG